MTAPSPAEQIRIICNVGHGLETRYTRRYQQAIGAVLALAEPHDQPHQPAYSNTRGGSDYGRGFTDGLRAAYGAVINELARALVEPDAEAADD